MALYEETKRIQQELDAKYNQDDPLKYLFSKLPSINEGLVSSGMPTISAGNISESAGGIYLPKDKRRYGRFFGEVYDPTVGVENIAAQRQSGAEKLAYMVPRIGTKVLSEVLQLPGYLGGAVAWAGTGFDLDKINYMVDNFWQKAVQSAEQTVKDTAFPVYVSDKVKEGNLFQNIISPEFWSTEGADGIGFLLAFLAPGQALKATGIGMKTARLIKPGNKIAKLMRAGMASEEAVNAATRATAQAIDFVGATLINTLFESAAEGGETYRNILDKTGDKEKAGYAAADVVKKNFGILLASNAVDQYWLFKDVRFFKKASTDQVENLAKKSVMSRLFDPKTGKPLTEIAAKSGWEKTGAYTKAWLGGIGKEGFYEEGMQFAASKRAEEKAENPEDDRGFVGELVETLDTYLDSLSDTDMQKSIFLGGVLGGGMSMIHTIRQERAEKRLLEGTQKREASPLAKFFGAKDRIETPGLKQLLARNIATLHTSMVDLAVMETDKDGNLVPVTEANGLYKLDQQKVEKLAEDKLVDYAEKAKLVEYARTGNTEGFKYVKDKLDYRYMAPFLNQEGGIYVLLNHINEMAELEREYFAKEGLDYTLEEIKEELRTKALKFQEIHDRVNNTHDILLSTIKHDKTELDNFKKFSDTVRGNKINEENRIYFADGRMNTLRAELSNFKYGDSTIPISSAEDNLSDNLIPTLKESFKENKNKLSNTSSKHIENIIDDIDAHQKDLKASREYSANLYDKAWLNKTFKEYTTRTKEKKESTISGEKAKEAMPLDPKLKALYDRAVIMEEIDEPVKVVARHSADIEIGYLDATDDKIYKAIGKIVGTTNTGNLQIKINKAEVIGENGVVRLKNTDDNRVYFINKDETLHFQDRDFKIKSINIIKTAEEVQRETMNTVLLNSLKESLQKQRDFINDAKEDVQRQNDYIKELQDRLVALEEKELEYLNETGSKLTTSGTARKQLVMVARQAGKNRVKMFLDGMALRREINKAKEEATNLRDRRDLLIENKKKIEDLIKQAKQNDTFIKTFEESKKTYDELLISANDIVNKNNEIIDNSETYLKRLRSTLRGYYTTFANVLGISSLVDQTRRNPDITDEEKDEIISTHIANMFQTTELTEEQYEALGSLPQNIERLKTRINEKEREVNESKLLLEDAILKMKEYEELTTLYRILNNRFRQAYLEYLSKTLSVVEDVVDEETLKTETPEDKLSTLREDEETFSKTFEKEFRHVFYDDTSWLVSGGNQDHIIKNRNNDDLARWYIFVNKLAHSEKNNKYILKSFTFEQVGKLKENDIIRKALKFYVGNDQYATYDQILGMTRDKQDTTNNDIKMVVYERESGKVLITSKQVTDKSDNKYYVVYNSFIENQKGPLNFERFSIEKAKIEYLQKKKYSTPYTKEQLEEAEDKVQEELRKSWDKYVEFRETLRKNQYFFEIDHINPGIKNYDGLTGEIEVLEATDTTDIAELVKEKAFVIHKIGTRRGDKKTKKSSYGNQITRMLSGTEHGARSGYLYIRHDNRQELVKPRTLEETASVESVLNIIRYLATNPEDATEVEQFLHKIIYLNAQNREFRIFFTKFWGADKTRSGFRSLVYGDKNKGGGEIMSQDLIEGTNLDPLRTFLSTKFWNFDEKSLEETTFAEFKVDWNNGKPKVTSKLWDVKDGGYAGFLFTPIKGISIPKGTVYIKKHASSPLESALNPQYKNQSVALNPLGITYKELTKKASGKNTTTDKKAGDKRTLADVVSNEKKPPAKGKRTLAEMAEEEESEGLKSKSTLGKGKTLANAPIVTAAPATVGDIEYTSAEEYWQKGFTETERKAKRERFKNKTDEDIAKMAYTAYKNLHSGREPNRAIDQSGEYIKEEFNERIAWYTAKFPQIPISVIESALMNNSWGKLTTDGEVLISDLAAIGTVYHEAYHTYSLIFLDDLKRKSLYTSARKRTGRDMTDKEAEEFLAEEFREYMMNPTGYKFNKGEEVQKNWFRQLLDAILSILGLSIEKNFESINKKKAFMVSDKVLAERVKNIRENYERSRTISGLTEQETMHYVQDFNYSFFQILFDPTSRETQDALFDLDVSLPFIYDTLNLQYEERAKNEPAARQIFNNFEEVKKLHQRLLKSYRIKLPDPVVESKIVLPEDENQDLTNEEDLREDEKDGTSREWFDAHELDINLFLDNPIRLVIAGLPAVTMVNNMVRPSVSEYGTRMATKYSDIITVLRDNMATITSVEDMADKMKALASEYPELNILLKRLGLSGRKATIQQVNLQNQFYKNFAMNKNNPELTRYTQDGKKYSINAIDNNVRQQILNSWMNNARVISGEPGSYIYRNKNGEHMLRLKTLQKDLALWESLDKNRRLATSISILEGLGIQLAPDNKLIYKDERIYDYLFWLNEELKNKRNKVSLDDLYSNEVVRNQAEVQSLLDYTSKFYLNNRDLSYFNQDGNREFSVTLNSHLSNTVNLLNQINISKSKGVDFIPSEIQHLMPYDSKTDDGSLFNNHSKWIEQLIAGEKLELVLLKGMVTPTEGGEISKLLLGDYKVVTFNALLRGIVPFMRSADRKLEYGFRIGTSNYNITNDIFKNTMYNYLKDELATSFALLLDPVNWGGNLKHYSKNAKKLRVFSFLEDYGRIPSLEQYVEDHRPEDADPNSIKSKEESVVAANKLVTSFISTYKNHIDKAFNDYISDLEGMTMESLLEDNLIKAESSGRGKKRATKYFVPGIDTENLNKIGITVSRRDRPISEYDLNKLIRIATYNSFVGNNEQLKLFLGDLAYFRDAVDFHKRTTGASSTKYSQRDDVNLREHLDSEYRRFDNKKRTDSMSMLVVDDVDTIVNNDKLKEYFEAYTESNGTDAQSWITLDGYRDIMLRHGIWYPRHERTYQWEMQKFALRLIELDKAGRKFPIDINQIKGQFTDPNGVFAKHTNGSIPIIPMYLGVQLKESNLSPLTIIKPQGFGHISNIKGLNATQYWKTSAAPIFPSAISNDSPIFNILLSMVTNQQDVFTFSNYGSGSAIKGEVLGDRNGKIQRLYQTDNYLSQDIRYRDFGIQLDIHEETEGEVSISTQRTRLEFLDIFNLGEPVKNEELVKNRHDYTYTTNELETQLRSELLDELGIVETKLEDGNIVYDLPEENKNKFKKRLIDAFENRQLPLNVIDGLELALDSELKTFDLTLNKFKIEEVLTSMVRNKLIKRRVRGEMLIQESAFLYENPNVDRLLEFYQRTFPNGKNKKPVITPMDVMIALPRNLLKWVDSIGGLDVLNQAITDYNNNNITDIVKKVGEDFFKILTVPANRIPGQSLSSLDIIKVKKFLPHYHGNKVVIPAEATVKTGSDFDVDKLTTYFSYFNIKDGAIVYENRYNTIGGKQNRLNELANDSLLHPDRFMELITPTDPKYLKTKASQIKKKKPILSGVVYRSDNPQLRDVIHWWYNMQKGYEFWTSKHGVASVAVQNAAHAIEQNHPIVLNNVIPLMFSGQELEEGKTYKSGFITDSSGRKISNNFAEFLSAFVDAVKDPFIFEITDNENFSAIAALNRFGKDASVGIDSIIEFYSQNVIKDFMITKRSNNAKFMLFNQYNYNRYSKWRNTVRKNRNDQYRSVLQHLKSTLQPSKEALIPIDYSNSVSAAVEDYIQERTRVYQQNELLYTDKVELNIVTDNNPEIVKRKNEIKDRIEKAGYKYLTLQDLKDVKEGNLDNDTLFKYQVQILDNYMMYAQLGWNITTVNSFLRPDASSGFSRHLASINTSIIVPDQTIRRRGIVNHDSVINAIAGTTGNPSLIRQFFESKQNTPDFFAWSSIINKYPEIKNFFETQVYPVFGNPAKRMRRPKVESALETIESNFITFMLTKLLGNINTEDLQNVYREIFMSDNSTARQLLQMQVSTSGIKAIEELNPLISRKNKQSQTTSELDNISFFSKNYDATQWDAMEADVYDLYMNSNENSKEFVRSLILTSLFQSGYKKSPISFSEVIPNRVFVPMATMAIKMFVDQPEEVQREQLQSFLEQMYRNNADNKDIVPRNGYPVEYGKATITDKTRFHRNTDYIAADMFLDEPGKYYDMGKKPPMTVALFRRINDTEFEIISKQGDGIRFIEFYPEAKAGELDGISVLNSNLYSYEVKPLDTEEDERIPQEKNKEEDTEDEDNEGLYFAVPKPKQKSSFSKKKTNRKITGLTEYLDDQVKLDTKNDYAVKLGSETKIHQALRSIENNTSFETNKTMAQLLRVELRTPVTMKIFNDNRREELYDETGNTYNGYFIDTEKKYEPIEIGVYEKLDNFGFEVATIHEGIHALARRSYYTKPSFKGKIDELYQHAVNYLYIGRLGDVEVMEELKDLKNSALLDQDEFIAHGLSDPNFQKLLNSIPAANRDNVKDLSKSLFREFLEAIYDLFADFFRLNSGSRDVISYTAFTELLSIVDDMLVTKEEDMIEELSEESSMQDITILQRQLSGKQNNEFELNKEPEYRKGLIGDGSRRIVEKNPYEDFHGSSLKLLEKITKTTINDDVRALAVALLKVPVQKKYGGVLIMDKELFPHNVHEQMKNPLAILADGVYSPNNDAIYIDSQLNTKGFETIYLHEYLHRLTWKEYRENKIFKEKIDELYRIAGHYALGLPDKYYGMTSQDEFISEAFTNPEFRNFLATIPNNEDVEYKASNLFDKFMEIITDFINKWLKQAGEKKLDRTVLSDLVQVIGVNFDLRITESFDKVFPQYAHLTIQEKQNMKDLIDKGELNLACGL